MTVTTSGPGVRHPAAMMIEARRLHTDSEGALSVPEIGRQLAKAFGVRPTSDTIRRWIDPEYADKSRARNIISDRRWRARTGQYAFKLVQGGPDMKTTPEYRDAFIRRLRDAGVPRTSIAKVCTVVIPDIATTVDDVYRALGETSRNA